MTCAASYRTLVCTQLAVFSSAEQDMGDWAYRGQEVLTRSRRHLYHTGPSYKEVGSRLF